jgi:hypothetical protein
MTYDALQIGLHLQRAGNFDGDNGEISFGSIDLADIAEDFAYVDNISLQGYWQVAIVNL